VTAVFGDFLHPAAAHITAAVACPGDLPDDARTGVIQHLTRLTATLARYAADIPLPADGILPGQQPAHSPARAALDARLSFRRAAQALRYGTDLSAPASPGGTHPVVQHLAAAADYLAAGRDLLHTHLTPSPATAPGRSCWAPVITCLPVTAALLAEIASYARALAPWAARLSVAGPANSAVPAAASLSLHAATQWLWMASAAVEAAQRTQPPPATGRMLLHAIPASTPPDRRPPADGEPVADLCAGITVTAERLRHAALAPAPAGQHGWSASATSPAWRRNALASAITTHTAEITLRALARQARDLGTSPAICGQLETAATAMSQAWPAWRTVAHQWDTVRTGTHREPEPAPAAGEHADLVLRAGRLAYGNPHWTPATADTSNTREPADLAPDRAALTSVTAALHTTADAIGCTGAQDREAVRTAAAGRHLYKSTLVLASSLTARRHRYRPIDAERTDAILTAYDNALQATAAATTALEDLALTLDAPTAILAVARRTAAQYQAHSTHRPRPRPQPAPLPAAPATSTLESTLRAHNITSPSLLARATALDNATHDLLTEATAAAHHRKAVTPPSLATPPITPPPRARR
jgi:hypothetical protein